MKDKLPAIILVTFLLVGSVLSWTFGFMLYFMSGVLVVLSLLKMLRWNGFVHAYRKYDLLAKQSKTWAYVYPVVEFVLGVTFIFSFHIQIAAVVLGLLMLENLISVLLVIRDKKVLMCACMGTLIKVRLTTLTLTEDIIMILMALSILI